MYDTARIQLYVCLLQHPPRASLSSLSLLYLSLFSLSLLHKCPIAARVLVIRQRQQHFLVEFELTRKLPLQLPDGIEVLLEDR